MSASACGCCPPGGLGCDTEGICLTVEFQGIGFVDYFAACNGDPDCLPDELLASWGINRAIRVSGVTVPAFPGVGIRSISLPVGVTIVRSPDNTAPACGGLPEAFSWAGGLSMVISFACIDGEITILGLSLVSDTSNKPPPADPRFSARSMFYFTWTGEAALGEAIPNQFTISPPGSEPCGGSLEIHGLGGFATVTATTGGNCDQVPVYQFADPCEGDGDPITVDPDTAPAGLYGIEFDEEDYRLTGRPSTETPVSVTWQAEVCPDDPPPSGLKLANKCRPGNYGPDQIAYLPNDFYGGAGAGSVSLTIQEIGVNCYRVVWYNPTTEDAPDGLMVGIHQQAAACSQQDLRVCEGDDAGGRPININTLCAPGGLCDSVTNPPAWLVSLCDRCNPPAETEARSAPTATLAAPVRSRTPARVWSLREMIVAYTQARLSGRGAAPEVIEERRRSCFGGEGEPPCPMLRGEPGRRFCGACGCGARREALLEPDPETGRSKLEFVKLRCPLKRPGFTNA